MAITRLELGLLDLIVDCTRLINVYGADMVKQESKHNGNDQELIQSDPTSCPQNQKGNN